jgi:hypothetical protein
MSESPSQAHASHASQETMTIRYYDSQQAAYGGIDLHARSLHGSILDFRGQKVIWSQPGGVRGNRREEWMTPIT